MDVGTAKKLIEKNLSYDEVKRLTVKLVQHASPQTELLEAEPQVLALIRDVIKPELEQSGLKPFVDKMGNLVLHLKGRDSQRPVDARRLRHVRGAEHDGESLFRRDRRRRAVQARRRVRLGPGRLRAEGQSGGDDGGDQIHRRQPKWSCPAIYISSSAPPARPASMIRSPTFWIRTRSRRTGALSTDRRRFSSATRGGWTCASSCAANSRTAAARGRGSTPSPAR